MTLLSDPWIAVTASLPAYRKWVWVKLDTGEVAIGYRQLGWQVDTWHWDGMGYNDKRRVVGWQELSRKKPE